MPQDVCRLIYSGSIFQILPTGFQSCFDVLEAHSVLDKPALNYSQLCMFDLPGRNNPVPKASARLPGLAAPRSQKHARAGRGDTHPHNCLGTGQVGPAKFPKSRSRPGMATQLCPDSAVQDTFASPELPSCGDSQLVTRQVKGNAPSAFPYHSPVCWEMPAGPQT